MPYLSPGALSHGRHDRSSPSAALWQPCPRDLTRCHGPSHAETAADCARLWDQDLRGCLYANAAHEERTCARGVPLGCPMAAVTSSQGDSDGGTEAPEPLRWPAS